MTAVIINTVHFVSAVIVLIEALNKLERTSICAPGITPRARITACLKGAAWGLLAVGAASGIITPLLRLPPPTFDDACIVLGFAVLIIRTRIK